MSKRKLKTLSLDDKLRLITEVESSEAKRKKDIAAEYGIPANTLSTIMANKEKIIQQHAASGSPSTSKRVRPSPFSDIDEALMMWFQEHRTNNVESITTIKRNMSKQKRKTLSLDHKICLIADMECNAGLIRKKDIAAKYGIPVTTVYTIMANKEKILQHAASGSTATRKRVRTSTYSDIDEALVKWFREQWTDRSTMPISRPVLKEKALSLAKLFGHNDFQASTGWLDRFKARYGISFKTICGETDHMHESNCNNMHHSKQTSDDLFHSSKQTCDNQFHSSKQTSDGGIQSPNQTYDDRLQPPSNDRPQSPNQMIIYKRAPNRTMMFKEMEEYHLCIVGAGMIGSAAARYASVDPTLKVCLVGPGEPEDLNSRDIFSAHYDEGRVTRVIDVDLVSQQLAKASIARYREIERLSEIPFYDPVGTLFIGEKNTEFTRLMEQACINNNLPVEDISDMNIFKRKFPFMKLMCDEVVLLDNSGAGHISARKLVAAQQEIASKQGCIIIRDIVSHIEEDIQRTGLTRLKLKTDTGNTILAQRVLICTGAFTNYRQLLPNYGSFMPDMKVTQDTVAMLEISEEEAERLRTMPSILYDRDHYPNIQHSIGAYILPPIKYPDGKWYLKIGHGSEFEQELHTGEEIKEWYLSNGNNQVVKEYSDILKNLLPGLKVLSIKGRTCVTSHTPSTLPYIDRITPILTVAIAGNGKGAKMSDELGRLAAYLCIKGEWCSAIPQSLFSFRWKPC